MPRKAHNLALRNPSQLQPSLDWNDIDFITPFSVENALWGVIVSYTGHPLLIDWLAKFIDSEAIPARNPQALTKALQQYSLKNIKYFREKPERFASPLRTLNWKLGDCDDKTIFIAASLRSFRIPVRIKIITFYIVNPKTNKVTRKKHVLPLVYLHGSWYPVESVTDIPIGIDPEKMANKKGIKTSSRVIGDSHVDA